MPIFRQTQLLPTVALAFTLAACGTTVPEGVVTSEGAPARIVRESTGGIATLRVTVELDSTSARWTRTTCSLPADGGACRSNTHIEEGTVPAATRDALFADARERAFLDLPAQYRASGQVADGMAHRMVITTSGFTRTMRWEDGADLPPLLDRYLTNLASATTR